MPKIELTDDEITLLEEAIELDIDHTMSDAKASGMQKYDRAIRFSRLEKKLARASRLDGINKLLDYGNAEVADIVYRSMDTEQ